MKYGRATHTACSMRVGNKRLPFRHAERVFRLPCMPYPNAA
ncbi:hypothetical protein [Kingella sp. (in: b-proteobacteria)]|nr:hypothetical protein [Kingella sp. (in: b-proteobacteria)]MDO4657304.1 hypothetical protein [Kingella sp. (in: b-proteobacteria)]